MITREGYNKDPSIMPEGIAVTFSQEMIKENGGLLKFIRYFESCFLDENDYWMHWCRNKPRFDNLLYVYVILCNRVYYRCYYGGYQLRVPDADQLSPHLVLAGPLERAPSKILKPGFRGFRYTTKLF